MRRWARKASRAAVRSRGDARAICAHPGWHRQLAGAISARAEHVPDQDEDCCEQQGHDEATKSFVLVVPDGASNDDANTTFTSQADAETGADDLFGFTNTGRLTNVTIPYAQYALSLGPNVRFVPPQSLTDQRSPTPTSRPFSKLATISACAHWQPRMAGLCRTVRRYRSCRIPHSSSTVSTRATRSPPIWRHATKRRSTKRLLRSIQVSAMSSSGPKRCISKANFGRREKAASANCLMPVLASAKEANCSSL